MADKEKIVLLTRLAVYDKHMSEPDKKINNFFLHDYIYAKNIWTRFYAFIGSLILILFYALYRIFVEGADIFALDYKKELTNIVFFIAAVLLVYTALGGIQAAVSYKASQKRIKAYLEVLKKTGGDRADGERAYERRHGRDLIYTGGNIKRGKKI